VEDEKTERKGEAEEGDVVIVLLLLLSLFAGVEWLNQVLGGACCAIGCV
jgi:hypothetical protein